MGFSTKITLVGIFLGTVLWFSGCSPSLHDAASKGNVEQLRTIIEKGADVNAKDIDEWAPLHHAAWEGHKECVELLIAKGATVDIRGGKIHNPLLSVLAPLPEHIVAPPKNETPLHLAAEQGHLEVVKVLIDHGANINSKRSDGMTPLVLSFRSLIVPSLIISNIKRPAEETVCILLEKGADVNVAPDGLAGGTALHLAAGSGNKRLVKLILEHGANVNAPDNVGYTPLHNAVMVDKADKELVKLLLDHGADVNAKCFWGATPLKSSKNNEIKELLRQYGAKE